MYQTLLKEISKHHVQIIALVNQKDNIHVNTVIFWNNFHGNTETFREKYFLKCDTKIWELSKIEEKIKISELHETQKSSLLHEVYVKKEKIDFLKKVYDTEALKINPKHKNSVTSKIDYDKYNSLFFWTSKNDIYSAPKFKAHTLPDITFSEEKLYSLIQYSRKILPELDFSLWDYPWNFYRNCKIHIPQKESYNIQDIICLFFHETTHFFRDYNGYKNLWFFYRFEWVPTLEEGIALYNEFYYGNQIVNYWEYIPHYNYCFQALLENTSFDEKKQKVYEVLRHKLFDKKKSDKYFYRFYRFSAYNSDDFFLKDLIYYSGYQRVQKLMQDEKVYEKIMAGKIGTFELKNNILKPENNLGSKWYFEKMMREIKLILYKK